MDHGTAYKRAMRGLCPTQPASECAGTLWPARPGPSGHSIAANIDADLQKVGCASRPLRSVGRRSLISLADLALFCQVHVHK